MKRNMGKWDRITRSLAGLALVAIGIGGGYNLQLLILGTVAALTGAAGLCPAYLPFGFDTLDEAADRAAAAPIMTKKAA